MEFEDLVAEMRILDKTYDSLRLNAEVYEDAQEDYENILDQTSAQPKAITSVRDNLMGLYQRLMNLGYTCERMDEIYDFIQKYHPEMPLPQDLEESLEDKLEFRINCRDKYLMNLAVKITHLSILIGDTKH